MSLYGYYGRTFPLQMRGQPIMAKTLNAPIQALADLHRRRVNPGLLSLEAGGIQNEFGVGDDSLYARLIAASGSGGAYTWQGIAEDPDTPGSWIDLASQYSDRGGDYLCWEVNGNATLTAGTRVYMRLSEVTGLYLFQYGTCP
jgi:hypothetical protein